MARLIVKGKRLAQVEIVTDDEAGSYSYACPCGDSYSTTYSLEEALQAADVHVDHNCPRRLWASGAKERA